MERRAETPEITSNFTGGSVPYSSLLMVFPAAMIWAASTDMATMKIPNAVSVALVAACIVLALVFGMSWGALALQLSAGAIMLLVGMGLFARGLIGGGDAKLFAATAAWTGWGQLFPYLLIAALAGGVLALVIIFYRQAELPAWLAGKPWLARLHDADQGIPYGVALAVGGLIVFPQTIWIELAAKAAS